MGLIQIAKNAIQGTLKEQWKEAIRCEDLGNDILMAKKTTPTGVISNKSTVIVGPGQCAVIFDNGRIIDATAEEGLYTFDTSSTPSFLAGQFGEVFKEMWQRFTYKGASAKEQAVYFFNIKEIIENKFGTPAPVTFQDWSHAIPNQMTGELIPMRTEVRCHGKYTFKISNPALFMSEIAGTASIYKKDLLIEQMRSEVTEAFQNVLNALGNSEHKVPVMQLREQVSLIKKIMNENVYDDPIRRRGISIVGFVVESVLLDEESEKKIDDYEFAANSHMQQGKLAGSYANAVENAAKNDKGVAHGFMGIGLMNMASNGMIGGAAQVPWQNNQNNNQVATNNNVNESNNKDNSGNVELQRWECPTCNNLVDGNFCTYCGTKRPEQPKIKFCSNCGTKLQEGDKFCPQCGEKVL